MNRSERLFVEDIFEAIVSIEKFMDGVDYEYFIINKEKLYAVKHAIQIIGEAANKLSDETIAKYNEAPWKEIVGMRNKIVHDYFGLNVRLIWKTIKEDMLPLKSVIIKMLEDNTIN